MTLFVVGGIAENAVDHLACPDERIVDLLVSDGAPPEVLDESPDHHGHAGVGRCDVL